MSDFLGKGISAQFMVDDDRFVMVSAEKSVEESIKIILSTDKGERVMQPDFGADINSLAYSENNVSTATLLSDKIRKALEKWEPRIEVLEVIVDPDENQGNVLFITIEYKILSTNSDRNLVYPFYLQGAP